MQLSNNDKPSEVGLKKSGSTSARSEEQASRSISIDIPKISLPQGGGAIKGIDEKFQVNAANGTASLR